VEHRVNADQVLLQLGISGAVLFVAYKIALVVLRNWREAESERTAAYAKAEDQRTTALAAGFMSLSGKLDQHHTLDIESHRELGQDLAQIKGALGVREDLTPVNVPIPVGPQPTGTHRRTPAGGLRLPRPGSHHDKDG
jgi:hypothetical protein